MLPALAESGVRTGACRAEFALNFLKSNVGIDSSALLSSPFLLVTLGYYGHKRNYLFGAEESQRLRHWMLVANAKGRYSRGSSETLLDQDLIISLDHKGSHYRLQFRHIFPKEVLKNGYIPREAYDIANLALLAEGPSQD
jgi:hemin uptake protein HemP